MAELSQATIGGPQQVAISPVEPANTSSGIGEGLALLGQFVSGTPQQHGSKDRQQKGLNKKTACLVCMLLS